MQRSAWPTAMDQTGHCGWRVGLATLLLTVGMARAQAAPDAATAAHDRALARHLLRLQQARFEAQNRGEPPARLKALARQFQHTQRRWRQRQQAEPSADD